MTTAFDRARLASRDHMRIKLAMNAIIDLAEKEISRAEYTVKEALLATLNDDRLIRSDITLGPWACPESPTDRCYYNALHDPALDQCLCCGEPYERK